MDCGAPSSQSRINGFVSVKTYKFNGASSWQSCINGFVGVFISSSDTNKKTVKAMDKFLYFVSKEHKNTMKQRSTESYFKKRN